MQLCSLPLLKSTETFVVPQESQHTIDRIEESVLEDLLHVLRPSSRFALKAPASVHKCVRVGVCMYAHVCAYTHVGACTTRVRERMCMCVRVCVHVCVYHKTRSTAGFHSLLAFFKPWLIISNLAPSQ